MNRAGLQESSIDALEGHVIMCGAEESFLPFLEQLRKVEATETQVVLMHPARPPTIWPAMAALGPTHFVLVRPTPRQRDGRLHAPACLVQGQACILVSMQLQSRCVIAAA